MENFDEFQVHNLFKYSLDEYKSRDPQLQRIAKLPFSYLSPLSTEPHFKIPGIYLVTGGRQVGKTTFLKQYILQLLSQGEVNPQDILFLAGELIDSYHKLIRLVEVFSKHDRLQYLFIDEVNYIPDWDKAIKYLADAGYLEKTVVMLTGSDSLILRTAMQRFAGRRGQADVVDYVFYPLSFKEFALLKQPKLAELCAKLSESEWVSECKLYMESHGTLMQLLDEYVVHGGYLPAIANIWQEHTIYPGTLRTYIEWIVGDMLKFRKTEKQVFEILKGILTTYSTQISWNSLLKHLSIEHHQTVSDYCHLLQDIHVLYILEAVNENTRLAAPKKNKKIYFQDPFIYHAANAFVHHDLSFDRIQKSVHNTTTLSELIEGIVIAHCKRHWDTYYLKGKLGEVDVAIVEDDEIQPIEIKWTSQIRPEEIKQIKLYDHGLILWNRPELRWIDKTPVLPLPQFLLRDTK